MDAFAITEGMVPESNHQDGHDPEKDTAVKLPEGANKFQRAIAAWRGTMLDTSDALGAIRQTANPSISYRHRLDQHRREVG